MFCNKIYNFGTSKLVSFCRYDNFVCFTRLGIVLVYLFEFYSSDLYGYVDHLPIFVQYMKVEISRGFFFFFLSCSMFLSWNAKSFAFFNVAGVVVNIAMLEKFSVIWQYTGVNRKVSFLNLHWNTKCLGLYNKCN